MCQIRGRHLSRNNRQMNLKSGQNEGFEKEKTKLMIQDGTKTAEQCLLELRTNMEMDEDTTVEDMGRLCKETTLLLQEYNKTGNRQKM